MILFVYGSLRRGLHMHSALGLAEYATFQGEFNLIGYSMYDLGAYPGIIHDPSGVIVVEKYQIQSSEILHLLDEYEGYVSPLKAYKSKHNYKEVSLFLREKVWDGPRLLGYIYVYNRDVGAAPVIENGDWCEYNLSKSN